MRHILFSLIFILSIGKNDSKAQQKQVEKPNILWITIEDTSPEFIGVYGNSYAKTPNIDKIATEGVRFNNAFSTGTVCSPSRSCIITGVKTYKLGTGHHRSSVPIPDYIKGFPYYLQKEGYYTTNNKKTDYNIANEDAFIDKAWNESSDNAGWWNRKPGQPFFAVFNYAESHQSRTMTWPYPQYKKEIYDQLKPEERIGDNEFPMPPIYHDSPEMRKQFARVYNSLKFTDKKIGDLLDKLDKDHLRDSTIIFFYADHGEGMPRGKTNGIDYGYRVPFVIWFPPMYSHLSPWGKAGVVSSELIDFEDLAPTMISLAQGKAPDYMTGRILIGKDRSQPVDQLFLSNDRADNSPDLVRTITDGEFMYSRNFMAFEPELRYIRYMEIADVKQQMRNDFKKGKLDKFQQSLFAPRAPEVLFDIKNDPWEMNNLAQDPKYNKQLLNLRENLIKHMINEKDVLLLPEYETNEISKSQILFEYRQDSNKFPVNEICEAASLSGFRGKEIAVKQIAMLNSPDKFIRYWAIIGLRSQPSEILKFYQTEIIKAINDTYPPIATTASAIAFQEFANESGRERLKQFCTDPNMDISLMAVNYLLYLDNKAPFIETVKLVYNMPDRNYNVKAACLDFLGSLGLVPNDFKHSE